MEVQWGFEYFEDTDEIPTQEERDRYGGNYNPPEYFFTVKVGDTEFGKDEQASGLLQFRDWVEISMAYESGEPAADEEYILHLADGSTRNGTLDSDGRAREEDVPPGSIVIEVTNEEVYLTPLAEAVGSEEDGAASRSADWIDVELRYEDGEPASNLEYVLHLADGSEVKGNLDAHGRARMTGLAPGELTIELPDISNLIKSG